MSDAQQQLIFAMTSINNMAKGIESLTQAGENFLETIFESIRASSEGHNLKKYLGADKTVVPYVALPGAEEKIKKQLKIEGIPHTHTNHGSFSLFIVADNQKEKMDQIIKKCQAELIRGGNVPKDILWAQADGKVNKITGLTEEEAMLLESKAEDRNIHVTVLQKSGYEYHALYDQKDSDELAKITASVAYDLSGDSGLLLKRQLNYELDNQYRITLRAADTKDNGVFIVDADGKTLKCNSFYAEYRDESKGEQEEGQMIRRNPKGMQTIIGGMRHPIDLTREEYKEYSSLDREAQKEFLIHIDQSHGRPQFTKEEADLLRQHEEDRSLVEKKLLYETPIQGHVYNGITDNEIRMATFTELNRENAEDMHDDAEIFQADPILFDDARASLKRMTVKEEFPDPEYDIREDYDTNEREKEDREECESDEREDPSANSEYVDNADRNNNGVPDNQELSEEEEERCC